MPSSEEPNDARGWERTPKGRRQAEAILAAATASLARDGFSGATLSRIAAEAEVDKRRVLYYFGSREVLLAQVVRRLASRIAVRVEAALTDATDPRGFAEGVEALWAGTIEDPELPRAYMALLSGSQDSAVRRELCALDEVFLRIFDDRVRALQERGYELTVNRESFVSFLYAIARGLVLEWQEYGDTPRLRDGLAEYKRVATSRFVALAEESGTERA